MPRQGQGTKINLNCFELTLFDTYKHRPRYFRRNARFHIEIDSV
jgi:hypothetical protein